MHIVCPHCTTSYAIDPATLGMAGRTVRCSRCKEVWLARPEDAIEIAPVAAMAAAGQEAGNADDTAAQWEAMAREEGEASDTPVIDSPSISGDWPGGGAGAAARPAAKAVGQPAHILRRHGRAGAGADHLAGRRGATVAADRDVLQIGRA